MILTKNVRSYMMAMISFISMIVVNGLAIILPLNGLSTGQIADLYPNLFLPSGITFGIWSLIYGFLAVFLILGWTRREETIVAKVLPYFTLSCILNLSWILAWHYLLPGISVIIMTGLLVTLIVIFKRVKLEKSNDLRMKVWMSISMTAYLAWICVASIANVASFLVSLNWRGGIVPESIWTFIMMSAATVLALKITSKFISPSFSAVVIWALLGIYIRWRESDYSIIIYGSIFLICLMLVNLIYIIRKHHLMSK